MHTTGRVSDDEVIAVIAYLDPDLDSGLAIREVRFDTSSFGLWAKATLIISTIVLLLAAAKSLPILINFPR